MTRQVWYLRRGVAWHPVLGCCATAVALAALTARWPASAVMLLPTLVACCAGAAAFAFDEPATAVVRVTPRGGSWRRTARAAVVLLPLALWSVVVWVRPGDLPLSRPGWLLIGVAAIALGLGLAGVASRRGVDRPGSGLSALIAVATLGPVVSFGFLGIDTPYPIGPFDDATRTFWVVVGAAAALLVAVALAPMSERTALRLLGSPGR